MFPSTRIAMASDQVGTFLRAREDSLLTASSAGSSSSCQSTRSGSTMASLDRGGRLRGAGSRSLEAVGWGMSSEASSICSEPPRSPAVREPRPPRRPRRRRRRGPGSSEDSRSAGSADGASASSGASSISHGSTSLLVRAEASEKAGGLGGAVERPGLVGSAPLANARREGRRWPRRSEGESSAPRGEFGVAREVGAAAAASRRASRGGSGFRTCSRRGGGESSRDLECSVNPRASRCPSVALDPPLPPSRLVSRPRGLVGVDSTSDGERLWASVEGGGATASSGVSQRLGLPRRFLPDAPKESWTDPADSSGIRTAGPDGGTAGGGSGLTGRAGLAGVPQKPNPPESAFAGLSDDEPPPIPKNLEMASQDELFFGVGLRSEASEAGALGAWGVGGAAS